MRQLNRIGRALDEANKTGKIELEDNDYDLIKGFFERYCPALWGASQEIMAEVEKIMGVK
jgi:hypothetical protein